MGFTEKAVKHFGLTVDFREAGFILPDGKMLDFSGRHWDRHVPGGWRTVSHDDLLEADEDEPSSMEEIAGKYGMIRIYQCYGAEILSAPTGAQWKKLKELFEYCLFEKQSKAAYRLDLVDGYNQYDTVTIDDYESFGDAKKRVIAFFKKICDCKTGFEPCCGRGD